MGSNVKKPLVEAALGRHPARRPVWFMRQAGRFLPEYREVRAKVDFTTLCQTPELAAEVTIQPLRRYDVDASIIFSDILIPAVGMGQKLTFDKGEGPQLSNPVRDAASLKALKRPNADKDLGYVGDAIGLVKKVLKPEQTMIGFAGAPFTVASYMIEGSGSKTFSKVKHLMFRDTAVFKGLLDLIAEVTVDYLAMQVKAGADALMFFDTWAGNLTPEDYKIHVYPVMKQLFANVKKLGVPLMYFPGQGSDRMYELSGLGMDVVSVDWRTRLPRAAKILKETGLDVTLQGNLDPLALIAPEAVVRQRTRDLIKDVKDAGARSHIYNVGHGLTPETPPDSLIWVIDELRKP